MPTAICRGRIFQCCAQGHRVLSCLLDEVQILASQAQSAIKLAGGNNGSEREDRAIPFSGEQGAEIMGMVVAIAQIKF